MYEFGLVACVSFLRMVALLCDSKQHPRWQHPAGGTRALKDAETRDEAVVMSFLDAHVGRSLKNTQGQQEDSSANKARRLGCACHGNLEEHPEKLLLAHGERPGRASGIGALQPLLSFAQHPCCE